MAKQVLSAIMDEDMNAVLAKMGLLRPFEEGQISCCQCGKQVTLKNLQFILPQEGGGAQVVCDSTDCIDTFLTTSAVTQ